MSTYEIDVNRTSLHRVDSQNAVSGQSHRGLCVNLGCFRAAGHMSPSFGSRHPASEIRGIVDAAGALIARYLRIGAKRPRAGDAARWVAVCLVFGREDLVRRRALLHPVLKRGCHRIAEAVGSRTASAMLHAGTM